MLTFKSITSRITILHIGAVIVTAIVMPVVLSLFMASAVHSLHYRAVQEQAERLGRYLQHRPPEGLVLEIPEGLRYLFSDAYGRFAYAILDDHGSVLFSSKSDLTPLFPHSAQSTNDDFLTADFDNRVIEGVSIPKEVNGKTYWIQLGEDLAHRDVLLDDVTSQFLQNVGWTTIPILLLLLTANILIVRQAVQPLLRASKQAQEISPVRLDVRLPADGLPREVLPLVMAVNQALDRLEHGFQKQREFTADAAHELRTPLAVLRTRLALLSDQEAMGALQRDVDVMSRVVSQLLDSAEVETLVREPKEVADLQGVCAGVAQFIAPLALAQDKTISLRGPEEPILVNGNAEVLHRAIRNLAENALRHTPKGSAVELTLSKVGTVSVADSGLGIAPELRDRIFERFGSRDHFRTGGAGLGLSIVKRIVETYGGSISIENRRNGGVEFTISLVTASI